MKIEQFNKIVEEESFIGVSKSVISGFQAGGWFPPSTQSRGSLHVPTGTGLYQILSSPASVYWKILKTTSPFGVQLTGVSSRGLIQFP